MVTYCYLLTTSSLSVNKLNLLKPEMTRCHRYLKKHQTNINKLAKYMFLNGFSFSSNKTQFMVISRKKTAQYCHITVPNQSGQQKTSEGNSSQDRACKGDHVAKLHVLSPTIMASSLSEGRKSLSKLY